MSRILGIDYGDRRIGLALSDPMQVIASPFEVVDAPSEKQAIARIAEVVKDKEVGRIIVGLPINMDGSSGPRVEKTRTFIDKLKEAVDVPIQTWDERLSSSTAESALIEAGMRREKRKGVIDKIAAQVILQHYIDSLPPDANL